MWAQATDLELTQALTPRMQGDPTGVTCEYEWKHGCLGHARSYKNQPALADAAERASRVLRPGAAAEATLPARSAPSHPLAHLRDVLQRAMLKPPCALSFLGDSIMADFYSAAVHGALSLGFRRLSWCLQGVGEGPYWDSENKTLRQSCSDPPFNIYVSSDIYPDAFGATSAQVKLVDPPAGMTMHGDCEVLSLNLVRHAPGLMSRPEDASLPVEKLLDASSYMVMNQGNRANSQEVLPTLLDISVRPFIESRRFDKLLWRETLPQHFRSTTGSGSYEDCIKYEESSTAVTNNVSTYSRSRRFTTAVLEEEMLCDSCEPITDANAANWRNDVFKEWLKNTVPDAVNELRMVPAFNAFLDRHDLHLLHDCTHFLYSPFVWQPVWEGFAKAIDR